MAAKTDKAFYLIGPDGIPFEIANTAGVLSVDLAAGAEVALVTDSVIGMQGLASGVLAGIKIDSTTRTLQVIDYAHHEIHAGAHFKAGFQSLALDTDDTIELLFTTPDTAKWAHWVMTSQATGPVTIEVFEDTTVSNAGTPVTVFNRSRNSDNESVLTVTHTPTITGDGTKFATKWIGASGFKEQSGGDTRGDSEIILKKGTAYLIRLTANGDAIKAAIGGDWYEHTDA